MEVDSIARTILDGLKVLLAKHIEYLRVSLAKMKKLAGESSSDSSKKFEIHTMSCGNISHFHEGLVRRVGKVSNLLLNIAMMGSLSRRT